MPENEPLDPLDPVPPAPPAPPSARDVARARLAEAEQALHQLLIGRRPIELRNDTGTVRYHPGEESRLRAYIRQLKVEAGLARPARAIGVAFR